MVIDVTKTYFGDHFAMYTNIESYFTRETNIMFYVNYTSIKKKENNVISKI